MTEKDYTYTIKKLAKEYRRQTRARHQGSRMCWYISFCWQILGIFGMIMHTDGADACEVIGVLWVIIALLVRREE